MNIANNYNALGRLGPHYERPEYRPPERPAAGDSQDVGRGQRGDRRTLSTKNTDVPVKTAAVQVPMGRLNLDNVQKLISSTADMIRDLSPRTTSQEPHSYLPTSLMTPVYV